VLTGVLAAGADFSKAELVGAGLANGRFYGAAFHDADLTAARLEGAQFAGADFRGADLRQANLRGADLASAHGLTQDQIDEACLDSTTRLPPNLRPHPGCGPPLAQAIDHEVRAAMAKARAEIARAQAEATATATGH
jgi:uncharacterized protein YjbI with pentapeptide repeats